MTAGSRSSRRLIVHLLIVDSLGRSGSTLGSTIGALGGRSGRILALRCLLEFLENFLLCGSQI